jgi:hypothetical protein
LDGHNDDKIKLVDFIAKSKNLNLTDEISEGILNNLEE